MGCPKCNTGELRPVLNQLLCNRFPVCRHSEALQIVNSQNDQLTYVVFDTETTGTSNNDSIIEIGAMKVRGGQVIDEFEALINPGRYITMVITNLTGITNQDLMGQPTEEEVVPQFMEWLSDVDLLVAHNLPFDARMLKNTCRRIGIPNYAGQGVCTLQMARKTLPGQSHKLGDLCQFFGIELTNAHRAIYDVRATESLFRELRQNQQVYQPKAFGDFCKK